jgi:hypothetical protein
VSSVAKAVVKFKTTGQIAKDAGVELHRVLYVIRTRGIVEDARIGNLRVYGPTKCRQILKEVEEIKDDQAQP